MHRHEEILVRTFFVASKRDRYLAMLSGKKRSEALDRLNHLHDLDPRWSRALPRGSDALEELRARGASEMCYVISDIEEIDGRELPLAEAISKVQEVGWGTLLGCIPGKLAYYRGEHGEQELILERKAG